MKKKLISVVMTSVLSHSAFASSHADNQFVVDDEYTVHTVETQVFDVLKNDIGEGLIIDTVLSGYGEFDIIGNKVLFTPSEDVLNQENPSAKFGYTVTNKNGEKETGIVTINYEAVINNHAPVAVDDHLYAAKNQPVIANVLKNDYDPDKGDTLVVEEAFSPDALIDVQTDGLLRVDRINTEKSSIEVTYNLVDSNGDHDYATLTIDYLPDEDVILANDDLYNSIPQFESFSLSVLENDVIANDHTKIVSVISKLDVVQIVGEQIVFTPTNNFNYSLPYKFGYTISSNGHFDSAIVTLDFNQNPVNHPPTLNPDTVYADRLAQTIYIDPLKNDIDQDNDLLTITAAFSESGDTEIKGNKLEFTPNSDLSGSEAKILYEVSDGGFEGRAREMITVHYNPAQCEQDNS